VDTEHRERLGDSESGDGRTLPLAACPRARRGMLRAGRASDQAGPGYR